MIDCLKKVITTFSDQHLKNGYLDWDDIENLVEKTVIKIKKKTTRNTI